MRPAKFRDTFNRTAWLPDEIINRVRRFLLKSTCFTGWPRKSEDHVLSRPRLQRLIDGTNIMGK